MHEAETSRMNERVQNISRARRARELQLSLFRNQVNNSLRQAVSETHPIEISANSYELLLSLVDKAENAHDNLILDDVEGARDVNWLVELQSLLNSLTAKFYAYKVKYERRKANTPHWKE